jgi:uncharacterized protein YegL
MRLLPILILFTLGSIAQDLLIKDFNGDNYPLFEAEYLILDENSDPDFDATLELQINNNNLTINTECPEGSPPDAVSSVLAIDVSGSMNGERLELAKAGAKAWIDLLDFPNSDCAITSFSDQSYIVQDFTTDENLLINAVEGLFTIGGTNYTNGIYGQSTSPTAIIQGSKNKPVIVFLTDGTSDFDLNTAITEINKSGAIFYTISLLNSIPQKLKDFTEATGGVNFENVRSEEELVRAYKIINYISVGGSFCTVNWESDECDLIQNFVFTNQKYDLSETIRFSLNSNKQRRLEITENSFFEHGIITPPNTSEVQVTIKAINSDVNISEINTENPVFQIIDWGGTEPPFILLQDDERTLTIEYRPITENFQLAAFDIVSDACRGNSFIQAGGDRSRGDGSRDIRLIAPNGGERFEVGSDQEISWEGTLEDEAVCLEYSTDGGETWIYLGEGTNENFDWANIPDTPSEDCIARVTLKGAGRDLETTQIIADPSFGTTTYGGELTKDDSGNLIFVGHFHREIISNDQKIDNYSWERNRLAIIKFSPELNTLWMETVPMTVGCEIFINALDTDRDGNIYLGGSFKEGVLFPNTDNAISDGLKKSKAFLLKYSSDGEILDAVALGGSELLERETIHDIEIDEDNNIYISGIVVDYFAYQNANQKIDDETNDTYNPEFFVAKLGNNLDLIEFAFSTGLEPSVSNLSYHKGELIFAGGYKREGLQSNPLMSDNTAKYGIRTPDSIGDIFIFRYDKDLTQQGNFTIYGQDEQLLFDIEHDNSGNLLALGFTKADIIVNDETILDYQENSAVQPFLIKLLGSSSTNQWVKSFGSNSNDYATHLSTNEFNDVIISGFHSVPFDYGGNTFEVLESNKGLGANLFFLGFDSDGNVNQFNSPGEINSTKNSFPFGVEFDGKDFYIAGSFDENIFTNPILSAEGGDSDFFIKKFGEINIDDCSKLESSSNLTADKIVPILPTPGFFTQQGNNSVVDSKILESGDRFIYGNFRLTSRIRDKSLSKTGQSEAFYLAKESNGQIEWTSIGSPVDQQNFYGMRGTDMLVADDFIYITGLYQNDCEIIDANGNANTIQSEFQSDDLFTYNVFIAQYSLDGELILIEGIQMGEGITRNDNVLIDQQSDGDIVMAFNKESKEGEFPFQSFTIDGNTFGDGDFRKAIFMVELNPNLGFRRWYYFGISDDIGSNREIRLNDFQLDNNDIPIFAGSYAGVLQGYRSGETNSLFLKKGLKGMEEVWTRYFRAYTDLSNYGYSYNNINFDISVDNSIVFSTVFTGSIETNLDGLANDIDYTSPNGENSGNYTFVGKFDQNCEVVWNKVSSQLQPSQSSKIEPTEVFIDENEDIYLGLYHNSEFSFLENSFDINQNHSARLLKLDFQGNFLFSIELTGSNVPFPNANFPAINTISKADDEFLISGIFHGDLLLENGDVIKNTYPDNTIGFYGSLTEFDGNGGIFDESDDLWEIFKNEPDQLSLINEVDMGLVPVGTRKEKIENRFITLNSSKATTIEKVEFPDSDRFSLVSGLPINVESGESIDLEFAFEPTAPNFDESQIVVETSTSRSFSRIFGNGVEDNGEILLTPIDFGQVPINTTGRTLENDILRNNGFEFLPLVSNGIIGPDIQQFELNNLSTNIIDPNTNLSANITFAPNRLGRTSSILSLTNENSSKTYLVSLLGEGIELDTIELEISTNFIEAETGDRIIVPVLISDGEQLKNRRVSKIITDLEFNESLIYPIDENQIGDTYARKRTIPLEFEIENLEQNLLGKVPMLATLGDAQSTVLDIKNSRLLDADGNEITNIVLNETDGEFRLSDICWDGGARLLTSTGKYTIDIVPNPVKEEVLITFGIIETSNVRLTIYSAAGELIEEIYNENHEYGFYEEEFELDLQNGSYILIIETISGRKSVNFQVVR